MSTDSQNLARLLHQQLSSLAHDGVTDLPAGSGEHAFEFATPQTPAAPLAAETGAKPKPAATPAPKPPVISSMNLLGDGDYGPVVPAGERAAALTVVESEVAGCTKCDVLCASRTHTVFGVGDPNARLVFVGEGPGENEDRTGEPFVGAAGKLLNDILAACTLQREDVFILNMVKCRPPRNRNPTDEELANCWDYASRQLEILQPEFICCLGSVAAKTLLDTKQPLGRLRQQIHSFRGSRVVVTYHPAYLLRNKSAKRHVWDDMQMLMKEMGIDVSKR